MEFIESVPILSGDAPKKRVEDDEFGLAFIVRAIARTLSSQASSDGYAIGIEGPWGSGKTSLIHFVTEELSRSDPQHHIVFFDPWLLGDKSAALATFLGALAHTVETIEDSHHPWWRVDYWISKLFRRTLAAKIKTYGKYASAVSVATAKLSTFDPTGSIAVAAAGLGGFSLLHSIFGMREPTIVDLKNTISRKLTALQNRNPQQRIVAIVDDTDRLEPSEAAEVLRVVRAVANFPMLTYLICFDRKVLAHQLEAALEINNGSHYIDKIFQNIISVPPQEPFALRRLLRKLLSNSFPKALARSSESPSSDGYLEHVVLDLWAGQFLETPRDVVRLHEAIAFGWPHIASKCNFFDFVWLQLVKLKCPHLYNWTQIYLANVASFRDGGQAGQNERTQHADQLHKILKEYGWAEKAYLSGIGTILPGTNSFALEEGKRKVYEFQHSELAAFERDARLGSPSHWRQYFSFSLPTYAIEDHFISEFRKALAQDREAATSKLLDLLNRAHPRRGHFVEVLLDRLLDMKDSLLEAEREGLAVVFSASMDEIATATQDNWQYGRSEIWVKSLRLMHADGAETFVSLLRSGKAINWIAEVLRDQGLAHGLPNESRSDETRQWLSKEQLDTGIKVYSNRVLSGDYKLIFRSPAPLEILFLILQLGDRNAIQSYVQKSARTKEGLLTVLEGMCSWSSSSKDGIRHPLHQDYIEHFLDAALVKKRLQKIEQADTNKIFRDRASNLLKEWSTRSMV